MVFDDFFSFVSGAAARVWPSVTVAVFAFAIFVRPGAWRPLYMLLHPMRTGFASYSNEMKATSGGKETKQKPAGQ